MRSWVLWLAVAGVPACTDSPAPSPEPPGALGKTTPAIAAGPAAVATPAAPDEAACPADMVLVEGRFCPAADERCEKEEDPDYARKPDVSERCLKFTEPTSCASTRRRLQRFCVDRYEWPNEKGELPHVLADFRDATNACAAAGKRLCDEDEWLFACEGEEMLPYVNGYVRDPSACVIDRPYIQRPRRLERWDTCMESPDCKSDFERVDQRAPSGSISALRVAVRRVRHERQRERVGQPARATPAPRRTEGRLVGAGSRIAAARRCASTTSRITATKSDFAAAPTLVLEVRRADTPRGFVRRRRRVRGFRTRRVAIPLAAPPTCVHNPTRHGPTRGPRLPSAPLKQGRNGRQRARDLNKRFPEYLDRLRYRGGADPDIQGAPTHELAPPVRPLRPRARA